MPRAAVRGMAYDGRQPTPRRGGLCNPRGARDMAACMRVLVKPAA
ncbi:hypothetical protein RAA17_18380 [Komagataeibacter rhaeticus]|nr:hypothetical protein [Komagataeibacter rhaeticus]